MERAFSFDFSSVRVHAEEQSASAALSVEARAFTLGSHVVFAPGEYAPDTVEGRALLAHELGHVATARGNDGVIRRQDIPEFKQKGDTCDPASMLTAILMWDRERYGAEGGNHGFVTACHYAMEFLRKKRARFEKEWGKSVFESRFSAIRSMRNAAAKSKSKVTEEQYQELALILSELGGNAGEIEDAIGLRTTSESAESFQDIMGSKTLADLKPGERAQVQWYVRTKDVNANTGEESQGLGYHAVLIGRRKTGEWFMSDQQQGVILEAPSLGELRTKIEEASAAGTSWLITDPAQKRRLLTWTGVKKLDMGAIGAGAKYREEEPKRRRAAAAKRNEEAAVEHQAKVRKAAEPPSVEQFLPGPGFQQAPAESPLAIFEPMGQRRRDEDKVADVFAGQLSYMRKTAKWLKESAESEEKRASKEYAQVHSVYMSMRNPWRQQLEESIGHLRRLDESANGEAISRLERLLGWYDAHAKSALFGIPKPVASEGE